MLYFRNLRSTLFRWENIKGAHGYEDELATTAKMVFLKRKLHCREELTFAVTFLLQFVTSMLSLLQRGCWTSDLLSFKLHWGDSWFALLWSFYYLGHLVQWKLLLSKCIKYIFTQKPKQLDISSNWDYWLFKIFLFFHSSFIYKYTL